MARKYLFNSIEGTFDIVAGQEENCLLAMSAPQYSVNAGSTINLVDNIGGVTVNNGIVFNNTTHRATLKSGKTYKLQAFVRHDGSQAQTWSNYYWYDVTNSQSLGKISHCPSMDFNADDGTQPTANAIVIPSIDIEVELRCESVSNANQAVRDDSTQAIIEKIALLLMNMNIMLLVMM